MEHIQTKKFPGVHSFQAGRRAACRAGPAGEAQIQVSAFGKDCLDLVHKDTFFLSAEFDDLFRHVR